MALRTVLVSTKRQVTLPKSVRDSRGWQRGTRLHVTETEDGVLLRAAVAFEPTRMEQVFGRLKWDRSSLSISEMDAAVVAEGRRRARG